MNPYTFRTIIEPDVKGFHGYVPALKGCHTWGKTIIETRQHLREAIQVYCESLVKHGQRISRDESFETHETIDIQGAAHGRSLRYA